VNWYGRLAAVVDGPALHMASRSISPLEIGGTTNLAITPSTIKKMISTTKQGCRWGEEVAGLPPPSSAARRRRERRSDQQLEVDYLTERWRTRTRHERQVDEVGASTSPPVKERGNSRAIALRLPSDSGGSGVPHCRHRYRRDCAARPMDQSTTAEKRTSPNGGGGGAKLLFGSIPYLLDNGRVYQVVGMQFGIG